MFALLASLLSSIRRTFATDDNSGPARRLLERADSCAGLSPHQAQELRSAAQAYLRVVR